MRRRHLLKTTAVSAAALGSGLIVPAGAQAQRRPNVIIVLTDDQGLGDFSGEGNPVVKTPNVDAFAAQSVRFTDFHVCPVCTPTRGELMTGNGALHNLACAVTAGRTMVKRDMPTMAELFKADGYATGIFGKWHLGHAYPDRPMDRGFDRSIWFKGWGLQSEIEFDNDYVNPRYLDELEEKRADQYCTDLWFSSARTWMQSQVDASQPFLAYIPLNAPHLPMWPPTDPKYTEQYKDQNPQVAAFFQMIANIDDNLGSMLAWLDAEGEADNTVVVFLTDNGGTVGRTVFNSSLRDFKSSHYEGGHRVPCYLRWPGGGFDAGLAVNTPTQVIDLLPTLVDICGVNTGSATFDGVSLLPLALKQDFADRMLVVQYGLRDHPAKYDAAVIWNQWRLQKGTELYDIDADRSQQADVAAQNPDVVARMREFYDAWWARLAPATTVPIPMLLGAGVEEPEQLTSIDWWEVDCDNINFVSQGVGGPRGGVWHVDVKTAGKYRVELRRWPFHTGMALGSAGPTTTINGRPLGNMVKVMNVASATFAVNGLNQSYRVLPDMLGAEFEVELAEGPAQMQGWFTDNTGNDLCGAYYARFWKTA